MVNCWRKLKRRKGCGGGGGLLKTYIFREQNIELYLLNVNELN